MTASSDMSLRELACAAHRASTHGDSAIRTLAMSSLTSMVSDSPLLILQTWLDQFARTNGGSSPAEYAACERVYLLQALEKIVTAAGNASNDGSGDLNEGQAGKACIGRVIAVTTEEIVKQPSIIPDVQKPCSGVLVALGDRWELL